LLGWLAELRETLLWLIIKNTIPDSEESRSQKKRYTGKGLQDTEVRNPLSPNTWMHSPTGIHVNLLV
jgi:hypothetical protein